MENNEAVEAAIKEATEARIKGFEDYAGMAWIHVNALGVLIEAAENTRQNAGAVDVSDMVDKIKYHMMTERGKVSDEEVSGVCCAINYLSRRGLLKAQPIDLGPRHAMILEMESEKLSQPQKE